MPRSPHLTPVSNAVNTDYALWLHTALPIQLCFQYRSSIGRRGTEADLGMFSMFVRTGASQKRGPHRPEIVERYAMHYVLEAYRN